MKYDRNAAGYARSPAVPAPDSSVRSRFGRRNAALIEQRAVLGLVARRAIVLESHARAASSLRRIVFDELHVTTHESRTVLQLVDIDIGLLVALRSDRLLSDRSGERILRLRRGRSRSGPFERAGRFRSRRLRRRSVLCSARGQEESGRDSEEEAFRADSLHPRGKSIDFFRLQEHPGVQHAARLAFPHGRSIRFVAQ